jgi:hypothetical protein
MAKWLRAHGFTHVLLNFLWMRKGWGSARWEGLVLNGIRQGILTPVFQERKVAIYKIAVAMGD